MFVCQWHLDVPYGKQAEAVAIMRAWGKEKFPSSEFRRARGARLMAGTEGSSASHLVAEYLFDSLADFEAALAGMSGPQFRSHSAGGMSSPDRSTGWCIEGWPRAAVPLLKHADPAAACGLDVTKCGVPNSLPLSILPLRPEVT